MLLHFDKILTMPKYLRRIPGSYTIMLFLHFLVFTVLLSCSPKIKAVVNEKDASIAPTDFVVVLQKEDAFVNDGKEIGIIKSGDSGFSANCTYDEVIGELMATARQTGANVLKITEHKEPDQWSSCARITAKIYHVDNPYQFEKEIVWSKNRKLVWNDFKGTSKPVPGQEVAAVTRCGLSVHTNRVTNLKKPVFFVQAVFYCNQSWFRNDSSITPAILEHEQKHFDLCEVYARQLRLKLNGANLNAQNLNKGANKIFDDVNGQYLARQSLYDKETRHGQVIKEQEKWNEMIAKELSALEEFGE
jgi:hypothetical protein